MEKIIFMSEDMQEIEFFVLEQTKLNGVSYILVTDSEEGDAECWIMKDVSTEDSLESIYDAVVLESYEAMIWWKMTMNFLLFQKCLKNCWKTLILRDSMKSSLQGLPFIGACNC